MRACVVHLSRCGPAGRPAAPASARLRRSLGGAGTTPPRRQPPPPGPSRRSHAQAPPPANDEFRMTEASCPGSPKSPRESSSFRRLSALDAAETGGIRSPVRESRLAARAAAGESPQDPALGLSRRSPGAPGRKGPRGLSRARATMEPAPPDIRENRGDRPCPPGPRLLAHAESKFLSGWCPPN